MMYRTNRAVPFGALLAVALVAATPVFAGTSLRVAVITANGVTNGGSFPYTTTGPTGSFTAYTFYNTALANVSLANLQPGGAACAGLGCDTVLLNVASSGLGCQVNARLTTQQKTDLNEFVRLGGKMIIYDSECTAQNYSWLQYPFTTNNPGAMGAQGQLTIVENNDLSSNIPAEPKYIDEFRLETQTDAIGDMNVMTTFNANWCLDMTGTNFNRVTGPVHTYARYGSGLFLYNGFDVDVMNTSTPPVSTSGPGNIAKTWLQELQVEFNPTPLAALPCGLTVVGINVAPMAASNILPADSLHTVTATLLDINNVPQPNILVTFTVISGPNMGASGTCAANANCRTDANGQVSFTYQSNGAVGKDLVKACFTNQAGQLLCSQEAEKTWIVATEPCDIDQDGDVDRNDVNAIFAQRGKSATQFPALDIDKDGLITVNDARGCVLKCTRPNCAP